MPVSSSAAIGARLLYQVSVVLMLHVYLLDASTMGFLFHFLILNVIYQGLIPQRQSARNAIAFLVGVPVPLLHLLFTEPNVTRHTTFIVFASMREHVTWYKLLYLDMMVAGCVLLYHKVRV